MRIPETGTRSGHSGEFLVGLGDAVLAGSRAGGTQKGRPLGKGYKSKGKGLSTYGEPGEEATQGSVPATGVFQIVPGGKGRVVRDKSALG